MCLQRASPFSCWMWHPHIPDNGRNRSSHHVTTLTSNHGMNQSSHHVGRAHHLYLTMEGTNPLTMLEGLSTDTSLPLGRNIYLENTKLLPEVIKLHLSLWISQHISYLFIRHNILELHCSSLHHIPDIVILDMLRLVMEHRVLRQLHTTLVVTMYTSRSN